MAPGLRLATAQGARQRRHQAKQARGALRGGQPLEVSTLAPDWKCWRTEGTLSKPLYRELLCVSGDEPGALITKGCCQRHWAAPHGCLTTRFLDYSTPWLEKRCEFLLQARLSGRVTARGRRARSTARAAPGREGDVRRAGCAARGAVPARPAPRSGRDPCSARSAERMLRGSGAPPRGAHPARRAPCPRRAPAATRPDRCAVPRGYRAPRGGAACARAAPGVRAPPPPRRGDRRHARAARTPRSACGAGCAPRGARASRGAVRAKRALVSCPTGRRVLPNGE